MQTESLACKIACTGICLYLRAHARALRPIRVFSHMHKSYIDYNKYLRIQLGSLC